MENRSRLFTIVLGLLCAISIISALFMFGQVRKVETEYVDKEAEFIRENMDMSDRLDKLKNTIGEKTAEIRKIEEKSEKLEKRIVSIAEEKDKLEKLYENQIYVLEGEKKELQNKVTALNKVSLIELIRKAKDAEENESVRKLMGRTLQSIESIRSGKIVDLEPIVISESTALPDNKKIAMVEEIAVPAPPPSSLGEVLSVDKKNNLIVVNFGTQNRISEGQRLLILNDGEEIASAEIISARYKISAAFIDDIRYKHTIGEIKSGFSVQVAK